MNQKTLAQQTNFLDDYVVSFTLQSKLLFFAYWYQKLIQIENAEDHRTAPFQEKGQQGASAFAAADCDVNVNVALGIVYHEFHHKWK